MANWSKLLIRWAKMYIMLFVSNSTTGITHIKQMLSVLFDTPCYVTNVGKSVDVKVNIVSITSFHVFDLILAKYVPNKHNWFPFSCDALLPELKSKASFSVDWPYVCKDLKFSSSFPESICQFQLPNLAIRWKVFKIIKIRFRSFSKVKSK